MTRLCRCVDAPVIGAGAAGLTTARETSQARCTALVVEARERIGGAMGYAPTP